MSVEEARTGPADRLHVAHRLGGFRACRGATTCLGCALGWRVRSRPTLLESMAAIVPADWLARTAARRRARRPVPDVPGNSSRSRTGASIHWMLVASPWP